MLRVLSWKRLVCLALMLAGFASAEAQNVVINEIMFHPGLGRPGEDGYIPEESRKEFIELHNLSAAPANLRGCRFGKGVSFVFGDVTIAPGGFLVVAADDDVSRFKAAYAAEYPDVATAHVIGGWTGQLSNNGEGIELLNASGKRVDTVEYATEGDWARRREGHPYPGQDSWWRGWDWENGANAGGKSLELVSPALPNDSGQNWTASRTDGGTPGGENSAAAPGTAPLILNVRHRPPVPKSSDPVTITARIAPPPSSAAAVTLWTRVDGADAFTVAEMFDDGHHGDGAFSDGVYSAILPPQPNRTVVEFYVRVAAFGQTRTWPGPTDDQGSQGCNALFQIDDSVYKGAQPVYRLIIPKAELDAWSNLMDDTSGGRYSDAAMHAAFISMDGLGAEVRYCVDVRNRGAGTRAAHPHNLRVDFPDDNPWRGGTSLALNTRTVHAQVAGNAFFSLAGLPNTFGFAAQVRLNGENLAYPAPTGSKDSYQFGSYYAFQPYGKEWAEAHLPADPDANVYKAVWYFDGVKLSNNGGDLRYLGDDPASYRRAYGTNGPTSASGAYSKHTNVSDDDWTDLVQLVKTLDTANDSTYLEEVRKVVNVGEWLRYFAVNSLVGNMETTLGTGVGDDYWMFSGQTDPRFQVLPHDLDTVLGQGDTGPEYDRSIWRATRLPVLDRLLKHPPIARQYYAVLTELAGTVFSPERANAILDQRLAGWVSNDVIASMKDFAARRRAAVLAQIPAELSVSNSLPVVTTSSVVSLSGAADAIETHSVLVSGALAVWSAWSASWTAENVTLNPGVNRAVIQSLDADGRELDRSSADIWYDTGVLTTIPAGVLGANSTWTASGGPYRLAGDLVVPIGVTLAIEPGATIFCDSGARITVDGGSLRAVGTPSQRIRLTRYPGNVARWGGLRFINAPAVESIVAYTDIEYADAEAQVIWVRDSQVLFDRVTAANNNTKTFALFAPRVVIRNSVFNDPGEHEILTAQQAAPDGWFALEGNLFGTTSAGYDVIQLDHMGICAIRDNVFLGSGDDILQASETDLHVEGNLFMHARFGSTEQAASGAVRAGADESLGDAAPTPRRLTLVRNVFFENDYGLILGSQAYAEFFHNVFAVQRGAILFDEPWREGAGPARGCAIKSSIFWQSEPEDDLKGSGTFVHLTNGASDGNSQLTVNNSILPEAYHGYGAGNLDADPRFVRPTIQASLSSDSARFSAGFDGFEASRFLQLNGGAPDMRLQPESPAIRAGANGADMGYDVSSKATLTGLPETSTSATSVTVTVDGTDIAGYRYRLVGPGNVTNNWSAERESQQPIQLSGLASPGAYTLEVIRKNSLGIWQDASQPTSGTWFIDANAAPRVRLSEILAHNAGAAPDPSGGFADAVELFNESAESIDLDGMRLSNSTANPGQFIFPPGTILGGGGYLVVWSGMPSPASGLRLGFGLNRAGDAIYLWDKPANGGLLLDSAVFGAQLPDYSIGRIAGAGWTLTTPTFGSANRSVSLGRRSGLVLNEWLTSGRATPLPEFIELYNPDPAPVSLGGLALSLEPSLIPDAAAIPPLSYIAGGGFSIFYPDGEPALGANHLAFTMNSGPGAIGLFASDGTTIDIVLRGPPTADVSDGRYPDGGPGLAQLLEPTPGGGNAAPRRPSVIERRIELVGLTNRWRYSDAGLDLGVAWRAVDYDDAWWPAGQALFSAGSGDYPVAVNTGLALEDATGTRVITYYFRTGFVLESEVAGAALQARLVADDGAIVYLNGARVLSLGMPNDNEATSTTRPTRTVGTPDLEGPFLIASENFHPGNNVLAVEVHQVSDRSHDIAFALELSASTFVTNDVAPGRGLVRLNELLARNSIITNSSGTTPDWVELVNTSDQAVDVSGSSLTDEPEQPRKWVFPAPSVIPAHGSMIVECDSQASPSNLNTGFGLNAAGGVLLVHAAPAQGSALLDAVYYGLQTANLSIGRDELGQWTLCDPTPGLPNVIVPLGDPGSLRINEWMASQPAGPDWFELFNGGDRPAALGGLSWGDDLIQPGSEPIPALSFIGVGEAGYQVFIADESPFMGADHTSFKLSASGESIGLFGPDGALLDGVTFGPQAVGVSEGLISDGGGSAAKFPVPTPGGPNGGQASHFGSARMSGGGFEMTVAVASGQSCSIEFSDSLAAGRWITLADLAPRPDGEPVVVVDYSAAVRKARYYRIISRPAL